MRTVWPRMGSTASSSTPINCFAPGSSPRQLESRGEGGESPPSPVALMTRSTPLNASSKLLTSLLSNLTPSALSSYINHAQYAGALTLRVSKSTPWELLGHEVGERILYYRDPFLISEVVRERGMVRTEGTKERYQWSCSPASVAAYLVAWSFIANPVCTNSDNRALCTPMHQSALLSIPSE